MSQRALLRLKQKKKKYKATLKAPEKNYFKFGHQKYIGVFGFK